MKRPSYHHGDLANALTVAATELAREGGPEAIVLREAARQVGVSATAAYRHFANHGDLLHAVKECAAQMLAASMRAELANTVPEPGPAADAIRRMRALGVGYVRFALAEPGLFRTAFAPYHPLGALADLGHLAMVEPYQMLVESIDALVTAGALPAARRPWAEIFAWSAVHGLSILLLDGPLAVCPATEQEQIMNRILDGVGAGLTAP